jgi:hypothetical protein
LVDIDDHREFFRGRICHGFENSTIDKCGQVEQIVPQLSWKGVVPLCQLRLEDGPDLLVVFERLFQFFIAIASIPVFLAIL